MENKLWRDEFEKVFPAKAEAQQQLSIDKQELWKEPAIDALRAEKEYFLKIFTVIVDKLLGNCSRGIKEKWLDYVNSNNNSSNNNNLFSNK